MPKRRNLFIIIALLTAATAAFLLWPRPKEPEYQGHPLTYWICAYAQEQYQYWSPPVIRGRPADAPTPAQALKAMGPAALPWLLEWLRREPTAIPPHVKWLRSLSTGPLGRYIPKSLIAQDPLTAAEKAFFGFAILGPSARPAVPDLEHLATTTGDRETAVRAFEALCHVGPDAVPVIVSLMTNRHTLCRPDAIRLARELGPNTSLVKPALLHNLRDPDPNIVAATVSVLPSDWPARDGVLPNLENFLQSPHPAVRTEAILKLAQNPTNAAELIPLLNAALSDADSTVRLAATNVLGRIPSAIRTNTTTH
jgi:hypothetical protein